SLWHLCCSEVSISPLFRWPNSVNHFNLPWAILCWSGIFFATLWGFTGFGIARLSKEKQQQLMMETINESK
ncbi:hypothetical protein RNO66_26040, partial [Escherichia coli]|nr:hypothetical protein [Escherichia coli]